ncbi:MAG: hypothetical protein GY785_00045 [Gammaproteobacteria bacterium]|nr:hypothetical protein [Gammaproteobacteria bacterium]
MGTGNDFQRDVQFIIDPAAPPGIRSVTVTTPGGSASDDFSVLPAAIPALSSISPDTGEQGSNFNVILTGTNLANVTAVVSAGPEISSSIVSVSDTSVVANVTVSALATVGATTISALSPQGPSNALPFTVTAALDEITLSPAVLNLQTLETANMNVAINTIAGAGGQIIDLASDDTSAATVPATVTIPQGSSSTSFTVTTGNAAGSPNITASAGCFDPDTSQVNVSARGMTIDLLSSFIGVGRSASASIDLDQPAPVGGVTVDLVTGNAATATVNPTSVFIPQGASTASFDINGLVVGTTSLTATANGFVSDVESIIVTSSNVVNFGLIPDLAPGESVSLPTSLGQPAPAGGLTISFTSSNPSIATVTPSVFIAEGLQVPAANPKIAGLLLGSVTITGTATGFAPDSRIATVTLDSNFSPANLSVIESATQNITLQISAPAPAAGLTFNLGTDDAGIATVPATATVGAGQTSVQIVVSGIAVGATTLRANSAGLAEATASINVNPMPAINLGNTTVGDDLQIGLSGSLGLVAPAGGVLVTLTSSDPTKVLLSNSRSSAGGASINVQVNAGSSFISTFYVQSLTDTGTVTITTTAPGYATDTSSVTSVPSGFWFNSSNFTRDVFTSNVSIQVRSTRLSPGTLTRAQDQEIRGGHSVNLDLTNSDNTTGTLTVNPLVFNGGGGNAVNTAFDPLSAGTSTIGIVQPSGFDVPSNVNQSIVGTVTAPNITMNNVTVGKDLQISTFILLSNAPPSPVDVTLTIDDSSVALLSKDSATAGSASVTFNAIATTSVGSVYVQGLTLDSAQVTVQAAAYNDDTATVTVNPSGFWFNANSFTVDVAASNRSVNLRSTRLTPGTLTRSQDQAIRGGHSVSVDLTNSDAAVGALTINPVVFDGVPIALA